MVIAEHHEGGGTHRGAIRPPGPLSRGGAIAVGLLFVYLVSPVLRSAHVEGFSAQIQSLGHALAGGWVERHDLDLPLVSQFIFTSRPGTVSALAGLNLLTGSSSDANFRILTAISLLALVAACCLFAKRWSGVSYPAALLALMLVPGSLALGFYFNDNVVSTAFVAAAMAAVGPHSRLPAFIAAGALMAAAILCRIDAILALPMVALLAPMQRAEVRHVLLAALAFLAGFLPVTALGAYLAGFTMLDGIAVARLFEPPERLLAGPIQGLYFFGLIAAPLIALGAWRDVRPLRHWRSHPVEDPRRLWRLLLLIGYPLALLAYSAFAASEMRYFFPFLLPLIARLGGAGISVLLNTLTKRGPGFRAALLFTAAALAIFFAPPLLIQIRDGPSALTGAAWSPILWHRWQSLQQRSFAQVDAVVRDAASRPRTLLLSAGWNDEYYMRLRLMEAGYRSVETDRALPDCRAIATYRSGASEVLHIRLWPQYWQSPLKAPEHAALFVRTAYACPAVRRSEHIWAVTFNPIASPSLQAAGLKALAFASPLEVPVTSDPAGDRLRRLSGGEWPGAVQMPAFAARRMTQNELAVLAAQADALLRRSDAASAAARDRMLAADDQAFRPLPVGSRRWTP